MRRPLRRAIAAIESLTLQLLSAARAGGVAHRQIKGGSALKTQIPPGQAQGWSAPDGCAAGFSPDPLVCESR